MPRSENSSVNPRYTKHTTWKTINQSTVFIYPEIGGRVAAGGGGEQSQVPGGIAMLLVTGQVAIIVLEIQCILCVFIQK